MRIRELIKKYDGKTVVDSVSFQIPRGKVTSFIGPNGAGKSTVMGMISRLLQRDSGLIEFEGKDIKGWRSRELSRRLANPDPEQPDPDEAYRRRAGGIWAFSLFQRPFDG